MANLTASGYAPVNGISMYYEIYGEGEMPLVLIHGGGSTINSTFGKLIPLLAGCGKIIAVELQAHGRTSDRDAPESFEQDADDVARLLKHLQIEKANILGFSNGGTSTLQIAIRHPQMINRIVAVSANYRRDGMFPGFFDGMPHATIDVMPQSLKDDFLAVNPDRDKLQNMFEKDKQRMIDFKDIPDEYLAGIKSPALFLVADRDVMSVAHVLKMSQLVPGARLGVLPGTHGSVIGESTVEAEENNIPAAAVIMIKEFLSGKLD